MAVNRRGAVRIAIRGLENRMVSGEFVTVEDVEAIFVKHSKGVTDAGDLAYFRKTIDVSKGKVTLFYDKHRKLTVGEQCKKNFTIDPRMSRSQAMEYWCEFDEMEDSERLAYFENEESVTGSSFSSNLRSYDLDAANLDMTIGQLRSGVGSKTSRSFVGGRMIQMVKYCGRMVVFQPMQKVGSDE